MITLPLDIRPVLIRDGLQLPCAFSGILESMIAPALRPSRTRDGVIVFAVALAVITYVDRVCISRAAPHIQDDLGLSGKQMGWVFSAFTFAYALFEIPGGWLGDKMGPRRVLMRVVAFWSVFTAATGWAWNFVSMLVCRFFFGAGEAGCFPNLTKMFSIWLLQREHGLAQGITWLCARWGGAFTPLLVLWVLQIVLWRSAFLIFGVLDVIWAVVFYVWFRDNPRDHPGVNEAELKLLEESSHNSTPTPPSRGRSSFAAARCSCSGSTISASPTSGIFTLPGSPLT